MNQIMPFGKYKGENIEEVAIKDPNYIEWLKNQDFVNITLKQQIMNININNLDKKQDSPEHNLMQHKVYLDVEKYIYKILKKDKIKILSINKEIEKKINLIYYCDIYIKLNFNILGKEWNNTCFFIFEIKPVVGDDFMDIIRQIEKYVSSEKRGINYYDEAQPVLIYKDFKVSNLKFEEVQEIFESKKIKLIKYIEK